jgi:hypothetical protein
MADGKVARLEQNLSLRTVVLSGFRILPFEADGR